METGWSELALFYVETTYLIRCLAHGNRAAYLSRAAAIYYSVIDDHVSDSTDSIVQRPLGFVDDLKV